ncbi:6-phosphogluconolactonase [Saonia flava]|uniref:6-phosphogluconolactonase n=1 Tax=Saonia flava TaxID=523696 RepID=A0A846QUW5_9FLAO|nr:lactonase family protein [Saonia flava]NJB70352.1 6-phosphogluconolactonase [Saonia flava]
MNLYRVLAILLTMISCKEKENALEKQMSEENYFFVGTYTNKTSEGIYKYLLHDSGSMELIGLVAKSKNPSFLARSSDRKYIIAANEIKNESGVGTIESFLVTKDSLKFIGRSSSGGANPCFVNVDKSGYVLTANYSSGTIGLLYQNEKGKLSPLLNTLQHDENNELESTSKAHAHSAWFEKESNTIISIDLGINELWFTNLDSIEHKLVPYKQQSLKMDVGAGPRHLTFHPNRKWLYVVNELNNSITLVKKDNKGLYEKKQTISTLPQDYTEKSYCADIHISSDGKYLYASNRGHNSIAILGVDANTGFLKLIATESTKGDWPRNFSLSPDENYLLVANQYTDNIVSYSRNKSTGLLTYIDQVEASTPTCILF